MAMPTGARWLYGPWRDLLIGCGLWYVAAFVLLSVYGEPIRENGGRLWIPFVSLLVSTPHYGATLVRAYERREDRRAYSLFTTWASVALVALLVWGVRDPWVGSWILTVYITWSPWHYTGQNYGLAVMFLRRRGVALEGPGKRLLYASFLLSYLLTFLALHAGAPTSHYAPVSADASAIHFLPLGLAPDWGRNALLAAALAYGGVSLLVVALLIRRARLADLGPTLALMGLQALWFSLPLLLRTWEVDTGLEPWESADGAYYFLWIATGHAAQYLWVTSYYARREQTAPGAAPARYFPKVLLAGAAIWTLPSLVLAPGVLGRLSYDGGLAILVGAAVNLHHFVLDGAIWKLRDGRVARILLRSREPDPAAPIAPPRARWWPMAWAAGALCLAIQLGSKLETDLRLRDALLADDAPTARTSLERLRRVGRDSARARIALGRAMERRGDRSGALREYQRSLELQESAAAWVRIAGVHDAVRDWEGVATAYERASALSPHQAMLQYELGRALLRVDRPGEARAAFARAVALDPERGIYQTLLERASRAEEDPPAP